MLNPELLFKSFAIVVVIYILVKAFAPAIGDTFLSWFLGSTHKKNSDVDFDRMIEEKKAILRGDGNMTVSQALQTKKERKNRTDEALHNEFEKLTKKGSKSPTEEIRLAELKAFMAYADSLQWGGGPEFKEIASKISQGLGSRIDSQEVASAFSTLHMREVFLNGKGELLSFKKINESLESFVAMKALLKGGDTLNLLAKRWTMNSDSVAKALIVKLSSGKTDIKKFIATKNPPLPDLDGVKLISFLKSNSGGLKSKTEFFSEIKDEAELFHTLSPLPPLKGKNDKKGAYLSLGLPESANEEQIKKQYKKLARLKHPDRLKGKGIPQEFESIATENFTQIKEAYDILMKG